MPMLPVEIHSLDNTGPSIHEKCIWDENLCWLRDKKNIAVTMLSLLL